MTSHARPVIITGEPEAARFIPFPFDDPTIPVWPEVPGSPALPGAGLWRGAGARCAIVIGSVMDGRDVAQFGSALDWGSRGRRFKSGRPDAAHRPADHGERRGQRAYSCLSGPFLAVLDHP